MRLVEDYLSADDLEAIEQVLTSENPRFDLLVKLSGLNPRSDFKYSDLRRLNFCGADLRGFDFSGADLRQSVRNSSTLIDETTVLDNALVDWIEIEALPIVMKMQKIESASSSERRQQLLGDLTTEFGRTTHVITYMVSAAARAKTLDEFLDFCLYLPQSLTRDQSETLRPVALKLLKRKIAESKRRTGREKTAIFALDKIVEKLQFSNNSLAERVYSHLADVVNSKQQTVALKGMATIESKDIEAAFQRM